MCSQDRIGPPMPASRSWSASCASATPSQAAPASCAARAHSTAPWPYASAFTTAMTWASGLDSATRSRSRHVLARTASRSIRASALSGAAGAAAGKSVAGTLVIVCSLPGRRHRIVQGRVPDDVGMGWSRVESLESKVNGFLYANAAGRLVNERCGPFHVGFDADSDLVYLNYAVPEVGAAPSAADVAALVAVFEARGRLPRLEFAPGGAPLVEAALSTAGFTVQERLPFMVMGVGGLAPVAAAADVEVVVLTEESSDEELRGACLAQAEAFSDLDGAGDLSGAVAGLRASLERGGSSVLARGAAGTPDAGVPMGAGSFGAPRVGTTEVGGIGVREAFRRRGIGAAVTAALAADAFGRGVECVWLTPAGPDQERLYASVGFESVGEMLFMWKR